MTNIDIDNGLKQADPELYEHLMECVHKFEIRGSEEIFLKDWFGKAIVKESLLSLMRSKMINVVGVRDSNNELEPMFKQNFLKNDEEMNDLENPEDV